MFKETHILYLFFHQNFMLESALGSANLPGEVKSDIKLYTDIYFRLNGENKVLSTTA